MAASMDRLERPPVGPTPALASRADESFLAYLRDVRRELMFARGKEAFKKANEAMQAAGLEFEHSASRIEEIRALMRHAVPEAALWARTYRSTQDAFWSRVAGSYDESRDYFLRMLDESDQQGPGSVQWDPNYVYPEYAKAPIHSQPDGFVGDALSGLRYDYGTRVFHGNLEPGDPLHRTLAEKAAMPRDGKVRRIMDVACSIGQLSSELKRRFPDAEVWGSDISAPMVRYAHYRARAQGLDIHFLQKAGEDLDQLEPDSFDLVTTHLMFHEVPVPIMDRTIRNVFRLLRPGGTFWISDFPTLGSDPGTGGLNYTGFLAAIDSADNSEPYAPAFVRSNLERRLQEAGFSLRYTDPAEINIRGRVADKPAL